MEEKILKIIKSINTCQDIDDVIFAVVKKSIKYEVLDYEDRELVKKIILELLKN